MITPETFEAHLWEAGIVDPEGTHSEFSQKPGLHGQKIDFDGILNDSIEFEEWIEITAAAIDNLYPGKQRPEVLVATAYGTNRLARPVAKRLGSEVVGLATKKTEQGLVVLTTESYRTINVRKPELVLILDDVGTTGRNAASAAQSTEAAGAQSVEILYTWQRQMDLDKLTSRYKYQAIIKNFLPTFTPEDCNNNPEGFCAQGWKLNRYEK